MRSFDRKKIKAWCLLSNTLMYMHKQTQRNERNYENNKIKTELPQALAQRQGLYPHLTPKYQLLQIALMFLQSVFLCLQFCQHDKKFHEHFPCLKIKG